MDPLVSFGKCAESKMDKCYVAKKSIICACHRRRGNNYTLNLRSYRHLAIRTSFGTSTENT